MSVHTYSSREFTRDVAAAKQAALEGPVFITDRGTPAFVVLNIADYQRLQNKHAQSLFDLMQSLPTLPDDIGEISKMDIEFRELEF